MNEQFLAALIAAIVGLVTNIIVKKIEKEKTQEDKNKTVVETAEKSLEIMKETLLVLEERNKILEEKMKQFEENKELINTLYTVIFHVLNSAEVVMPDEMRSNLIDCVERRKDAQAKN